RSRAFQLFGPFTRSLAEQEGGSNGRRPEAVRAAEQRHQRLAQLFRTEGLGREERELPAVERLGEVGVFVRVRDPLEQIAGEVAAEGVETRGLTWRLGRRDRQPRADAARTPGEPVEGD